MSSSSNFFKKDKCDRCQQPLNIRTMSFMNEDIICPKCKDVEATHPRYQEAKIAENEAVKSGKIDYPGLFAGKKYEDI